MDKHVRIKDTSSTSMQNYDIVHGSSFHTVRLDGVADVEGKMANPVAE